MSATAVEKAIVWFIADTLKLAGVLTAAARPVSHFHKKQVYDDD